MNISALFSPTTPSTSPTALNKFSFERMTESFEIIEKEYTFNHSNNNSNNRNKNKTNQHQQSYVLPTTERFVKAMNEVVNLFDTLGSAFAFVRTDIDKKINILNRYFVHDQKHYSNLHDGVTYELESNTTRIKTSESASFSRTLLRLMWALKFADLLLEGLKQSFDPKSDLLSSERTLKWSVARAYESALAEHHSWTLRRAVKSACMLLPTKESFMQRLGVESNLKSEYLDRLAISMSPLVKRLYSFYETNNILDLP